MRDQVGITHDRGQGRAQVVARMRQHSSHSRQRCASLQSVALMGNAVPLALMEQLQQHLCAQVEIHYGLSEVGLIACLDQDSYHANPGVHGKLLPWVETQAVDETGCPVDTGQAGWICLRTPLIVEKYLNDPVASRSSFRDGWFLPGYAGSVDAQGYLRLTGEACRLPERKRSQTDGYRPLNTDRRQLFATA